MGCGQWEGSIGDNLERVIFEGGSSSARDLPEWFQFLVMGRNASASISDVAKRLRSQRSRKLQRGEGVKGESAIPTSAQGSARDWISG